MAKTAKAPETKDPNEEKSPIVAANAATFKYLKVYFDEVSGVLSMY